MRSITEECLNRMIFDRRASLRRAASAYLAHYEGERKHEGLGNRLLVLMEQIGGQSGSVRKRERLGGMLNYYFRLAAENRGRNNDGNHAVCGA